MKISENFQDVIDNYQNIQTLQPKEKYKKLKELSFALPKNDSLNLEQINLCINIINSAKKIAGYPEQLNKKLLIYKKMKLKYLGVDLSTLKIEFNKKLKLNTSAATLAIADTQYIPIIFSGDQLLEAHVAKGKLFAISTGYDGTFKVQVSLVNLEYPVFSDVEQKKILVNTDFYFLDIPSGKLTIGILSEKSIEIDIPKGQYRVCGNLDKSENYIFRIARVNEPSEEIANNAEIPLLEE